MNKINHKNSILSFIAKYYVLILLILILCLAGFFRLYKIDSYLKFYNDEAYQITKIKGIEQGHPPLVGPGAFNEEGYVGYHGPIYFYIMYIPYKLANFNPIAGGIFIALANVLALWLTFKLVKDLFNDKIALITVFLASCSWICIYYSRYAWNPNLIWLFSTLFFYALYKVINGKQQLIWVTTIALATSCQLHSSCYLLIPMALIIILIYKPKITLKTWLLNLGLFILFYVPMIIFEFRHNFTNTHGYYYLFLQSKSTMVYATVYDKIYRVVTVDLKNLVSLFTDKKEYQLATTWFLVLAFINFIYLSIRSFIKKGIKNSQNYLFIFIWVLFFIIFSSSYVLKHGNVWDYYMMLIWPPVFTITGIFLYKLGKNNFAGKILVAGLLIVALLFNLDIFTANFKDIDQARQTNKFTLFQHLAFCDMNNVTKYIADDANGAPFQVKYYTQTMPGFSYQLAYEYLFNYYHAKLSNDNSVRPIYMILQPQTVEHDDFSHYGTVSDTKNFGNLAVVKIISNN